MSLIRETTWDEALKAAEEEVPFIVDGLISSRSTLLYGEAKAGKSFFVSALVSALAQGQPEFLGRKINGDRPWRVGIAWTDDRGDAEYAQRISTVLPDGTTPDVRYYGVGIMRTWQHWNELYQRALATGRNFMAIDNLSQAVNGSINGDEAVNEFFAGVRMFVRAGIPVLIVGHSSEKSGDRGKPQHPLGSSVISSSVRSKLFYVSNFTRDRVTVKYSGADAEPWQLRLEHGVGARYAVTESRSVDTERQERATRERNRNAETLDRNAEVARHVVEHCQGMSRNATASAVADKFGGSVNTAKSHLSRRTAYGCLLASGAGNSWQLAGPLAS